MKDIQRFRDFVNKINAENGRLYKQSVLRKYKDDAIVKQFLKFSFDPFIQFGLGEKKLLKKLYTCEEALDFGSLDLLYYLQRHNTGTDYNAAHAYTVLQKISEVDMEASGILHSVICKSLSIGCDAKTINKEIPDLIPTFSVQLANKYFDKPEYVEGKTFAITTKIDGGRIIALKENGQVSFYTRAGQKYEGLVDLENEMFRLMPDNLCLDGEITLLTRGNLSSKDAYKETMKIVRTKDKEKHGIKMLVFDCMTAEEFKSQYCSNDYTVRRADAELLFNQIDFRYFELLPILYRGSDTSKITELLEEEVTNGEEGIMINICDAPYEFKRSSGLLKVKKFNSCDLRIKGFEEGSGRLKNTLGAIICEYKGGEVRVGSGFTDWLRAEIWSNQAKYLDTIVEISFFEETHDNTGTLSLRFPTFKDFRPDKVEADY